MPGHVMVQVHHHPHEPQPWLSSACAACRPLAQGPPAAFTWMGGPGGVGNGFSHTRALIIVPQTNKPWPWTHAAV